MENGTGTEVRPQEQANTLLFGRFKRQSLKVHHGTIFFFLFYKEVAIQEAGQNQITMDNKKP